MIYALLTAIYASKPTATPNPPFFPDMWNFAEVNFIDILGLLFTLGLGIAAFMVSRNANKLAKQQQQREEDMRKREAKIAVMDKAFEIYNFFMREVEDFDFLNKDIDAKIYFLKRTTEIGYLSNMLFDWKTLSKITELFEIINATVDLCKQENQSEREFLLMAGKYEFIDLLIKAKYNTLAEQVKIIKKHIVRKAQAIFNEYGLEL